MNAGNLLALFLIIALNSACAFGMGQRRCESPSLPVRPLTELCLTNDDGSSECFDERQNPSSYHKPPTAGQVCKNVHDYTAEEEWLKSVLSTCRGQ